MGQKQLSLAKQKEYAKMLFLNGHMTQKEIAADVGVSEQAMCRWASDGKWDELKTELNATNDEQIAFLNKQLRLLNEAGIKALSDDDPTTNPDTDGIIKITKAIHYLKTKTGVGQMYETGMEFLKFLQKEDAALAKQVAPLFHAFIKQNL